MNATYDERLALLLGTLHEESDAQMYARARAQFAGDEAAFGELAARYAALAPDRKGLFLREHGLATNDKDGSVDAGLSLAVSPAMGAFLANVVLATRPARVLELGSSNGVSTLYFARALRELGGGTVLACELDPSKCERLRANVAAAGLERFVEVCEGNMFDVVDRLDGTIELAFIDVWGSLYLEAFRRIERLLAPGSVVLADNMYTATDEVAPFKAYLEEHSRISTTTMAFESGVEFAVVLGASLSDE
jgi:predicted O-methyltransferase YrrM